MNIAIAEVCSKASDAEKGRIEIRPAISFEPESAVEFDRTDKNKDDFIAVTCRYRPSAGDYKKNNYVIQAKCFETGLTERMHYIGTLTPFTPRQITGFRRTW